MRVLVRVPVRVIAGTWRGRRIAVPDVPDLRPTPDRAREAIFNMAYALDLPQGAVVVDAFCGSGALGIEALSRGAAHVTFIDSNAQACASVQETLTSFQAPTDSFHIVCADALKTLQARFAQAQPAQDQPAQPVDLLLADPPYATDYWHDLLQLTPSQLDPSQPSPRVLIAEADHAIEAPPDTNWSLYRTRRYGRSHITILRQA